MPGSAGLVAALRWAPLAAALLMAVPAWGEEVRPDTPAVQAPVALLIDLGTGTVLFDRRSTAPIDPGPLVQLMVAAVADDAVRRGEAGPGTVYRLGDDAWRRGGAPSRGPSLQAAPRSRIAVADLLRGLAVDNAQDAALTLAAGLAGSEAAYVARMNRLAPALGMAHSTFTSVTGAADPRQTTTARDLAALARHQLDDPAARARYAEPAMVWNRLRQRNRNHLLEAVPGTDGLAEVEVGGTWAVVASAARGGRRLVLVLHGDPSERAATADGERLLDWGFAGFEARRLFAAGQRVGDAQVFGGERASVPLAVGPAVVMLVRRGAPPVRAELVYQGPVPAPVPAGARIGVLRLRSAPPAQDPPAKAVPAVSAVARAGLVGVRPAGHVTAAVSRETGRHDTGRGGTGVPAGAAGQEGSPPPPPGTATLEVPVTAAEAVGVGSLMQRALGATIELGTGVVRAAPVLR